jgi:Mn2+/Fe2+ NRAMP family transporter
VRDWESTQRDLTQKRHEEPILPYQYILYFLAKKLPLLLVIYEVLGMAIGINLLLASVDRWV